MHDRAIEILEQGGNKDQALALLIGSGGRDGAVQHFLNVFIRYANTTWAPNAGKRFREVESLLKEEFGRQIKANITEKQWREVELAQFREAKTLFNQARYADAAKAYLDVLMLFPEKSTSIPAMGELAASFIEEEDYILADAVARHIAERFHANEELSTEAGNQVIRIATKFTSVNQPVYYRTTYEVFFNYFTEHPRVLLDLQRFAREAMDAEDYDNAERYLMIIVKNHAGKPAYYTALSNLVKIYEEREDTDKQKRTLVHLIKELQKADMKSHLLISAQYRLANILRGEGDDGIETAQRLYGIIQKTLRGADAADYAKNEQEADANTKLLQAAIFYEAITDAMRKKVPPKVYAAFVKRAGGKQVPESLILDKYYKANAIKKLNQLIQAYPDSAFAPAALSQIGTLNTILGDAKAASEALDRLQKEYPDTAEAKNAVYMIGRNLLEMGRRDEAIEYFKQMFAGTTQYPAGQIFGAAQELLLAEEYAIALQAYNRVLAMTEDRRIIEPSKVGKGQALVALDQFAEAAEWMDGVLEEFPKSGLLVDICRTASAANAGLASVEQDSAKRQELFTKSIELMNRARRIAQDEAVRIELDIASAQLAERKAEAEEQFGTEEQANAYRNEAVASYQAVMMFRDASNPKLAPHIQVAYSRAVPLMAQLERWPDVMQDAQTYLEKFPNGRFVSEMREAVTKARIQGDV
jgi:TolA-binding protein